MNPTPNIEKNVISEVNRVREIMGLSLLTEEKNNLSYVIQLMVNDGKLKPMMQATVIALNKKLVKGGFGFPIHKVHDSGGKLYKWIIGPVNDTVYFDGEAKKGNGKLYAEKWKKILTSLYWPNTFIYKECYDKRIPMDQECTADSLEYHIVLDCVENIDEANPLIDQVKTLGYPTDIFYNNVSKCNFVTIGPYKSKSSAEKRLSRVKRKIEEMAWIYTTIGTEIKVTPKIDDEKEDIVDAEFDNIIFSDSLEGVKIPTFDPNEESKVYKCNMDGCAAYVKDVLGPYQGNAWHAHRMGNNIYSTFENAGTGNNEDMETLFNKINKNPQPTKGLSDARTIAKSLVPNQQKFSNLKLDDVVGLFYNPSEMHSTAFFEGMTGYDSEKGGPLAGGSLAGDGPFMVKTDGGDVWEPKHLGTDIEFKAGNTLSGGKSPGLNTHLGFVGAKVDGEPIIFHNIHKQVWATPLSQMSKGGTAIMWAKRGDGTTKKEVVSKEKGTMDKVKDEFMYYFNKIKSKL